jgi:hypothetical protein
MLRSDARKMLAAQAVSMAPPSTALPRVFHP